MKAWQIFVAGVAVLIAALLLPHYERLLTGAAAAIMIAVVLAGFFFTPRKNTFCLRTTLVVPGIDHQLFVEHDRILVRVESARLWLLFLPTFAAVSFLVITSARGTTWNFSLVNRFWDISAYPVVFIVEGLGALVFGLLSAWITERWVLRDAEACSADSTSMKAGGLLYSFRDPSGGYYGGEGFPFLLVRPTSLSRIVFYRPSDPQVSKIAMGLLFHRLVVVGRGITDLDEATVAQRSFKAEPLARPL